MESESGLIPFESLKATHKFAERCKLINVWINIPECNYILLSSGKRCGNLFKASKEGDLIIEDNIDSSWFTWSCILAAHRDVQKVGALHS